MIAGGREAEAELSVCTVGRKAPTVSDAHELQMRCDKARIGRDLAARKLRIEPSTVAAKNVDRKKRIASTRNSMQTGWLMQDGMETGTLSVDQSR